MITLIIKEIDENNNIQTTSVTGVKSYTVTNLNRILDVWLTCFKVDVIYQDNSTNNRKITDVIDVKAFENGVLIDTIKADLKSSRFK